MLGNIFCVVTTASLSVCSCCGVGVRVGGGLGWLGDFGDLADTRNEPRMVLVEHRYHLETASGITVAEVGVGCGVDGDWALTVRHG